MNAVVVTLALFGGFDATAPLHIGDVVPRAASCAACHPDENNAWQGSRHRSSATNALFADGFAVERHARCVYCHAPLTEQSAALLTRQPPSSASLVHEGITCAVCHVRDGVIYAAKPAHQYAHDVRVAPALRDSAMCASCHEFDAHEVNNGVMTMLPGQLVQSTYSEWRAYRDAGGGETCQSCHMPGGSHAFVKGAHDVAALKDALVVVQERAALVLSSRGVGHSYPSGDLFRHLSVWADDNEVARLGKRFVVEVDDDGAPHKRLADDTSLKPNEQRRVPMPKGATRWSVTYHYADDKAEARGVVPYDELVVTLWSAAAR